MGIWQCFVPEVHEEELCILGVRMIYIHILYFRGDGGPLERCSGGVSVSRENGVVTSIHQGAHRRLLHCNIKENQGPDEFCTVQLSPNF